jgi:hypothetical protein
MKKLNVRLHQFRVFIQIFHNSISFHSLLLEEYDIYQLINIKMKHNINYDFVC